MRMTHLHEVWHPINRLSASPFGHLPTVEEPLAVHIGLVSMMGSVGGSSRGVRRMLTKGALD